MTTGTTANTRLRKGSATMLRAGLALLRTPAMRADADAILFSAKSFAAAMLAYYIALRIGLPKPFWAIVTVYIVSQTSVGASLSRGVHRFAGTIAGAVATVAIVPNFVNDPIACSAALACWIGLCMFFSLLDRTPRAYAFVLAGYTASLIGFPSVLDPGAVFETASVRVQEISIGILCAILMHRYVVPRRMTGQFTGKLSATLQDARRLAMDVLKGTPGENRRDRNQLAADLLVLQGLATHLPYDAAPMTPRRGTLRLVHDRLARLLPLATEIEDRIRFLGAGSGSAPDDLRDDLPEDLSVLRGDVEAWIASAGTGGRDGSAAHLIGRARSIRKRLGADAATPGDRLAANLAGHLAEMVGLLQDCDRLVRTIRTVDRPRGPAPLHGPLRATGYVHHRDPWMAARAAMGAMVGILIGCAFWIWSAWPEGGTAVSILGVCCTLFGTVDTPVPNVIKYMVGSIHGVLISLAYGYVILPQVTSFAVLVAVLAPAFLFAGSLQARPPTTFRALGITLTLPILAGLGSSYTGDFAASLNMAIALFAAVGFGAVSMSLFQTVPVDTAINRLLHVSRRDVGRRALGAAPDETRWTSLMIDRTALLVPRLRVSGKACSDVLDDTLHHLRIGHAAGRLRKTIPRIEGDVGDGVRELLLAIAARFGTGGRTGPVDHIDLVRRIEALAALVAGSPVKDRPAMLDLLIDLRFALGSGETVEGEHSP